MTAQKYKLIRNNNFVVFYATMQQLKKFLTRHGFREINRLNQLLSPADPEDKIDFNLVKMVQNKHVLQEPVPFKRTALINKSCPFLAKMPSHKGDSRSGDIHLIEHYFCVMNFVRVKAAQLDPDYAILKQCCGIFIDEFEKELNKNV